VPACCGLLSLALNPVEDFMLKNRASRLLAALCGLFVSATVFAQELVMGLSTPVTSLDPHFHNLTPNNNVADHFFESLVGKDAKEHLRPLLAESWKAVNETTWEVKLRKGVKWHDGSDLTADDVVASIKRIPNVPNSPASFATYTRPLKDVSAVDKLTVRFVTERAHPLLPNDLVAIRIVPAKLAATVKTEEFNRGKAVIGTGPFKFKEYVAGDRVVLERNEAYWGAKPHWKTVRMRMITNSAARVAALLAGDVQMIEAVPTADAARLSKDARVNVASAVSNRIIYLHLDSDRAVSPFITAKDGKPLDRNPFKDVRVRKAVSLALDRDAIVSRIMEGQAQSAGQLLPDFFPGTSKKLPPPKQDLEQARKLLAEAGYPNGFAVTLHSPNNRYINDEKVAQAVASFLTRAGIDTKLEAMPSNVFFSRAGKLEFSFLLAGWGAETGETSSPLRALIGTFSTQTGMGQANRGRFSDPGVDALILSAMTNIDDTKRNLMLAAACDKAIGELQAIVPVQYEVSSWGLRKGLAYTGRSDQYTYAMEVRPATKEAVAGKTP
jgi:peptide/nickel transport system substrate-binding protein